MEFKPGLMYVCFKFCPTFRYPEDRVPSFLDNKPSIMDDLEKQGWPVARNDINLLEKEIEQAQTFLLQSKDLRQKSEEVWLTLTINSDGHRFSRIGI